jgi:glycosidase
VSWWKDAVVYQIYPRSFADSNGDGIGDLAGILAKLDVLAELGVDTLWLSPVHPSPQADFGYDVADYVGIDPIFGDLATFDRLVQAAHDRGLRLVLDGVFNHTSDQHPWFVASRRSRDDPKRDWYHWRDGRRPNNWASTFGGPAWTWDEATQQSYLHSFLPAQPDLNWSNPAVADAVLDAMRFWLERGVDGFRLDVFNCYC